MRTIEKGKLYKHFKGKLYQIIDIVNDSETNNDAETRKIVVYKALYGEGIVWARDYDMFLSEVDHVKYPEVKQKYRFEEFVRNFDEKGINAFITFEELNSEFDKLNIHNNVDSKEYDDFITKYIFAKIISSDIMFVKYDERDLKSVICMDHAFCHNVPVYLFAKKGNNVTKEIESLCEKVIYYNEINDVISEIKKLMKNGELKTNPNTLKLQ